MKKKVEGQIKALASKLLLHEDHLDVLSLKKSVKELYEQLVVLEYLESQIEGAQTAEAKRDSLDSKSYREQTWFKEPEPVPQPKHKEDLVEPLMEKIKDIVAQMPEETQQVDEMLEEVLPQNIYMKNDLEEFASNYQETPVFERKDQEIEIKTETIPHIIETVTQVPVEEKKPKSLNDKLNTGQGLNIGLNDRLAFIKHLFDGKSEDYTRVLSQISTMPNFDEAETFIKGKVKPSYNYWLHKDEFTERFMNIVEKSFN